MPRNGSAPTIRRAVIALLASAVVHDAVRAAAAAPEEQPIELATFTGTLRGTLTLPAPASAPAGPVVLMIAGSGPVDRDGNEPRLGVKTDMLKQLATGLAARGVS